MTPVSKYCILSNATIREALKQLNSLSTESSVLLVVDSTQKLVGTLTDGDIRRGIIAGHELDEPVSEMMHRDFTYLRDNEDYVSRIHDLRVNKISFVPIVNNEGKVIDVINQFSNSFIVSGQISKIIVVSKKQLPFDSCSPYTRNPLLSTLLDSSSKIWFLP